MKKKKLKLTEFVEPTLPMKPLAKPPAKEPMFKNPETIETLKKCKERIDDLYQDTYDYALRRYWDIGEQLIKAKKAIIKETGDKRAPGFIEWVENNFHFSATTGARMIKAFLEKRTDPKLIWGKKSLSPAPTKSTGENFTDKHFHWELKVTTKNKKVIWWLQNLDRFKETEVEWELRPEDVMGPLYVCQYEDCEEEIGPTSRTCKKHYQEFRKFMKGPDKDSKITWSENYTMWLEEHGKK